MTKLLDYSAGKPGADAIKRAGYAGAIRYVGIPGATKNTTAAELKDFQAHGLWMGFVFEQYKTDWRGGYDAGRQNYRRARDHVTSIGGDPESTIYMAVDEDVVSPAEFQAALNYIAGAVDEAGGVQHRVGTYGEFDVVRIVRDRFPNTRTWQCRAWSGTPPRLYDGRHVYQLSGASRDYVYVNGIACDENTVHADDWGQHGLQRGGAGAPTEDPKKRRKQMSGFVGFGFEFIDGPSKGFAVLVDQKNDRTTGVNADNVRAAMKEAGDLWFGVSDAEGQDLLKKYGAGNPKPEEPAPAPTAQEESDDTA